MYCIFFYYCFSWCILEDTPGFYLWILALLSFLWKHDLNINKGLILWVRISLSCCLHSVCLGGSISDVLSESTGRPQGCVPSPVLFSHFTNDFIINDNDFKLVKYAEEMAIFGLLQKHRLSWRCCGFWNLVQNNRTKLWPYQPGAATYTADLKTNTGRS